ncbi:1-phosphofructokinase family hexose kinase [Nocardia tengchongensis]|uniref:1-phosphofructokinase family hexose kinase n=1 Tax=Nocardia tengchongensis TaxID=2055889 RepID=A0ABX8CHF8_9NOCA|nr:1-phosphofructokinase family hexose kinase [Nocardia tengchongensis]QVI19399.1 1-phosphofructokinase family hexose kinase [Nocardia tengchongensis]
MSIVTLTMNPAIDLATTAAHIAPTDKIRCTAPRFDPGGGGINVARTVAALGEPVTAIFPAGGPPGRLLEELVRDAAIPMRPVPVADHTRENFAVTATDTGEQYRFVLPGPRLTAPEVHRCLAEIERAAQECRYVVASGSLPPGVPATFYQTLADLLSDLGVPLVLDTSGAALRAVGHGVHLIKPSVRELTEFAGRPLPDRESRVAAARELVERGVSEIVVVSMGAAGTLAVTRDDARWLTSIEVPVRSGIGAGDAQVGGIVVGLARGYPLDAAVRLGIAAATAALASPGTGPGRPDRIAELFQQLSPRPDAGRGQVAIPY